MGRRGQRQSERRRGERVDRHDGWFMFFGECWRILKPGGRVHVVAPWGMSVGGLTDPTHTRAIMLGSFEYLKRPEATATFDYEVPCNFELEPPLLKLTEEWLPKLADIEPADLTRIANTYFNVASELRIGLRAIKD